jgi:hypothetical protein
VAAGILPSLIVSNLPAKATARGGAVMDSPVDPGILASVASNNQAPKNIDPFWSDPDIELSRWDKLYPYQLLVLRVATQSDGTTSHTPEPGWAYTLPMPPEAFSVSTPFAITSAATLGGIVEDHNGTPFKMISLRGTTGILPARSSAQQQLGFGLIESIAGGTLTALREVTAALSSPGVNPNVHQSSEFDDSKISSNDASGILAKNTGYYQMKQLSRFLESYAAIKKTKAGRDLRLALAVWKDQAVYICTPQHLEVSKSSSGPLRQDYTLMLKAWRRVQLDVGSYGSPLGIPIRRDPNTMARLLNDIRSARRALQGLTKAAEAAVGDADRLIFEPLREVALFLKDLMGLTVTLADLPDSMTKRLHESWVQLQGESPAVARNASELNSVVKRASSLGHSAANEIRDYSGGKAATAALLSHPAKKAFQNPKANFDLMDKTDISSMRLNPAILRQITSERNRVSALRRADFEAHRDRIVASHAALASYLGAANAVYSALYNVNVTPIKSTPTDSDWEALYALNAASMVMDALAATGDGEPSSRAGRMDVMAGMARRAGIAFNVPTSKYAVPFPYGSTLESLAQLYLGDAQRWHEIAALNGLRSPYVDETGFDVPLSVNGNGNEVVITTPTEDLCVGQTVYVWSNTSQRTRRSITSLRNVGPNTIVTVDGEANMSEYRAVEGAQLSSFRLDTVNSQSLIYIPSSQVPADDNFITKSIPGVSEFDPMVAVGGVDLLLDSNNDLVITPDGSTRLAIGLTNIIQHTRIALDVKKGTLLNHSNFGLDQDVGMSSADFDPKKVVSAVRRMLSEDPAYTSVNVVQVSQNGPVAKVAISVNVAGTSKPVPISYEVKGDFQTG